MKSFSRGDRMKFSKDYLFIGGIVKKAIIIILIIMCALSGTVLWNSPKEDNPLASFMGAEWGQDVNTFLKTIKFPDQIKKRGFWASAKPGFYLLNFDLTDSLRLSSIGFFFTSKYPKAKVKLKKANYGKLFLKFVEIQISPDQFDNLFGIFKTKYGEPEVFHESKIQNRMGAEFLQKEAKWADHNIKRMIYMSKYSDTINLGRVMLVPYDEKLMKVKSEKEKKKGASKL